MKVIVYDPPDGPTAIVYPSKSWIRSGRRLQDLAAEVVPAGVPYQIVEDRVIPRDRTFRDAWRRNAESIGVNMTKAREIHREKVRRARKPRLEALDVEQMRRLEMPGADVSDVAQRKQRLRDMPADPEIENAKSPQALKAIWDAEMLGESPY